MPLAVRTEQWRVHHLARSIPPNQRTPQTTCQSRSHDGCPDTFRQPRAFAYLLRFNNEKIDKIGSTLTGTVHGTGPSWSASTSQYRPICTHPCSCLQRALLRGRLGHARRASTSGARGIVRAGATSRRHSVLLIQRRFGDVRDVNKYTPKTTEVRRAVRMPSLPPPLRLHSGSNTNVSILRHMLNNDNGAVTIGGKAMVHRRAEAGGAVCERIKLRTAALPFFALHRLCPLALRSRAGRLLSLWLFVLRKIQRCRGAGARL